MEEQVIGGKNTESVKEQGILEWGKEVLSGAK